MKATDRQKDIIKVVELQAQFWNDSNDLDSPTHLCDIDEMVNNLSFDNILSDEDSKELGEILQNLYFFIRNHK